MAQADKRFFATFLGWALLVLSMVTLVRFLSSDLFQEFWTFRWLISITFILGLYAAGLSVLGMRENGKPRAVRSSLGSFYLFVAIVIYVFLGFQQSFGGLKQSAFFGYLMLLALSSGTGMLSLSRASEAYLRFPSYAFGTAGVLYLIMLIKKYVFSGQVFNLKVFLGEVVIIAIGAFFFLKFFPSEEGS